MSKLFLSADLIFYFPHENKFFFSSFFSKLWKGGKKKKKTLEELVNSHERKNKLHLLYIYMNEKPVCVCVTQKQ